MLHKDISLWKSQFLNLAQMFFVLLSLLSLLSPLKEQKRQKLACSPLLYLSFSSLHSSLWQGAICSSPPTSPSPPRITFTRPRRTRWPNWNSASSRALNAKGRSPDVCSAAKDGLKRVCNEPFLLPAESFLSRSFNTIHSSFKTLFAPLLPVFAIRFSQTNTLLVLHHSGQFQFSYMIRVIVSFHLIPPSFCLHLFVAIFFWLSTYFYLCVLVLILVLWLTSVLVLDPSLSSIP